MENFTYYIPTKVYFGRGQIKHLGPAAKEYGNKALLVHYGNASEKEQEIVQEVKTELDKSGVSYFSFTNVEPNPQIASVAQGNVIARANGVGLIIAVGGGSAIDCAKGICATALYDGDPWEVVKNASLIAETIPLACVSTMAATGSEMDSAAVISNAAVNEKINFFCEDVRPKFAILDPEYTFSVPPYQTACGGVDILSHAMEVYFSNTPDTAFQNNMAEALMRTVIKYTPIAYRDPTNYEARANLMWASPWAINCFLMWGKDIDWSIHNIEHEVSAHYNVTHGAGMAAITPAWMEYMLDQDTVDNFVSYAVNVWGVPMVSDKMAVARAGIQETRKFYAELGMPKNLQEIGVKKESFEAMAKGAIANNDWRGQGVIKAIKPLAYDDMLNIIKMAY